MDLCVNVLWENQDYHVSVRAGGLYCRPFYKRSGKLRLLVYHCKGRDKLLCKGVYSKFCVSCQVLSSWNGCVLVMRGKRRFRMTRFAIKNGTKSFWRFLNFNIKHFQAAKIRQPSQFYHRPCTHDHCTCKKARELKDEGKEGGEQGGEGIWQTSCSWISHFIRELEETR